MQQAPAQIATVVNSKVAALTLNAFILFIYRSVGFTQFDCQ